MGSTQGVWWGVYIASDRNWNLHRVVRRFVLLGYDLDCSEDVSCGETNPSTQQAHASNVSRSKDPLGVDPKSVPHGLNLSAFQDK